MASAGQSTEQARQAQDVDAVPTLAWSARPDGSAEFLNRRWLDYTGLSAEEASDWGWTAALHTEDPGKLHHASVGIVGIVGIVSMRSALVGVQPVFERLPHLFCL